MNKNKNLGFTLAEVLIVIGIIGVVAALTLPNLNHATGDKETVTRVKKLYSTLTEAFDRAQVIYGPFDTWFNDLGDEDRAEKSERFAKRVTEFMKISKDCGTNEGCYPTEIKGFDGNDNSGYKGYFNYALLDGSGLSFDDVGVRDTGDTVSRIYIDVNGSNKGQNRTGYDVFKFQVINNTIYPAESYSLDDPEYVESPNYYAYWIYTYGNLDYIKCFDDLEWETKTSCE